MSFTLPPYGPPDFSKPPFSDAPFTIFREVTRAGILPEYYHATTIYPEYFHLRDSGWRLLEESRMDCGVILKEDGSLQVREFRHIEEGELVACGRKENGEEGLYIHTNGFEIPDQTLEKFAFRSRISRESAFSVDYDEL